MFAPSPPGTPDRGATPRTGRRDGRGSPMGSPSHQPSESAVRAAENARFERRCIICLGDPLDPVNTPLPERPLAMRCCGQLVCKACFKDHFNCNGDRVPNGYADGRGRQVTSVTETHACPHCKKHIHWVSACGLCGMTTCRSVRLSREQRFYSILYAYSAASAGMRRAQP